MIKFSCSDSKGGDDAGEAYVKDNSEGSLVPHLDQSHAGTADNPAHDTITCSGYCKGCARSSEKKAYICCVGPGCGANATSATAPACTSSTSSTSGGSSTSS